MPHPGPYQHWELVELAEQRDRLWYEHNSYNLAYHAAFHGVKNARPRQFNPYRGAGSFSAGQWKQFAEDAKKNLPDELGNDEIMERWEEFKEREPE